MSTTEQSAPVSSPERISHDRLAQILNDPAASSSTVVVDVRGDDFARGHVRGAVSIPYDVVLDDEKLDTEVIEKLKTYPNVVFHCQLSQVRGPTSAARYQAALAKKDGIVSAVKQQVYVLDGGYGNWEQVYKGTDLVEE
ncbi:Rhodanese-like domain-containing protein [Cladochytrium replicatum]|nr:Rhodanese-like domain-containing protein [Cladochytrium replicatum]